MLSVPEQADSLKGSGGRGSGGSDHIRDTVSQRRFRQGARRGKDRCLFRERGRPDSGEEALIKALRRGAEGRCEKGRGHFVQGAVTLPTSFSCLLFFFPPFLKLEPIRIVFSGLLPQCLVSA